MSVKVIQTRYNHILYRSRTEARWAVFFDCAGIPFDYEPNGFVVREGAYLPDFWLPEQRMFFEVKGAEPTALECAKCASLTEVAECDVLLAVGPPEPKFMLLWFDRSGQRDDRYALARDRYAECGFWLVAEDHCNLIGPMRTTHTPGGPMFSGALDEAYGLARAERFEDARKRHPKIPETSIDRQIEREAA